MQVSQVSSHSKIGKSLEQLISQMSQKQMSRKMLIFVLDPPIFRGVGVCFFLPVHTWFSFFYCKDEILNFPRKLPPTLGKFPKHLKNASEVD